MKRLLIVAALLLSGCVRMHTVEQPDGTLEIHDRVAIILASDMADDAKVQLVMALLERENQRGTNVVSAWQQVFSWLATGVALAK